MGRKFKPMKSKSFTELNHRMNNDYQFKLKKISKQWDDLNKYVPAYELNNGNEKTSFDNSDNQVRQRKKALLRNSGESSKGIKKSDIQREVDKLMAATNKKRSRRQRRKAARRMDLTANSEINKADTYNAVKNKGADEDSNKRRAVEIDSLLNKSSSLFKKKRCVEVVPEDSANEAQTHNDVPKTSRRSSQKSTFVELEGLQLVKTARSAVNHQKKNYLKKPKENCYVTAPSDDEAAKDDSSCNKKDAVEDSDEMYEIDLMGDSDEVEDEEMESCDSDANFIDDDENGEIKGDKLNYLNGQPNHESTATKKDKLEISNDEVMDLLNESTVLNWQERTSRSKNISPIDLIPGDHESSSDEDFNVDSEDAVEDEEEPDSSIGPDEVNDLLNDITGNDEEEFFINREDEERVLNLDSAGLKLRPIGLSIADYFVDESALKFIQVERDEDCERSKEPASFTLFGFSSDDKHSFNVGIEALRWLLSPFDVQLFFDDIYTKRAVIIRRHNSDYYNNVFSLSDFYNMIQNNFLEYGVNVNIAMYKNGIRTTYNPTGRVYSGVVRALVDKNLSVQCINPQSFNKNIHYLCDVLQEVFHCFVGANCYYTPKGSSGFAPHYDNIDAFLIQTEGRKHWRVYAPVEDEQWPLDSSPNFSLEEMEKHKDRLVFDDWLYTGDVLYLPRGFIHHAETHPEHDSLHVTISVAMNHAYCNLVEKVVNKLLEAQTASIAQMRRNLPCDLFNIDGVACSSYNNCAKISKLVTPISLYVDQLQVGLHEAIPSAVDEMARDFMRRSLPPLLTDHERNYSIHRIWDDVPIPPVFTKDMEVRLIRKHTQRLLFESRKRAFLVHRMENSMIYEGRPESVIDVPFILIKGIERLLKTYPNWVSVERMGKRFKENISVVKFLYHHGLLMIRAVENSDVACESSKQSEHSWTTSTSKVSAVSRKKKKRGRKHRKHNSTTH